jgi:hypothetical protein
MRSLRIIAEKKNHTGVEITIITDAPDKGSELGKTLKKVAY